MLDFHIFLLSKQNIFLLQKQILLNKIFLLLNSQKDTHRSQQFLVEANQHKQINIIMQMMEQHKKQIFMMAFKFKIIEENLQNQISQLKKSLEDVIKSLEDGKILRQKQFQKSTKKSQQISLLKQQFAKVKNELQTKNEQLKQKNKLLQIVTKQLDNTQEQLKSTKRQLDQLKNNNALLRDNQQYIGKNILKPAIRQEKQDNEIIMKQQISTLRKQLLKNSEILTTQQQSQTLINLFQPIKIKSLKLIYRASENQFSVKKFHKECDKTRNTLVIVKTKYGKVVGGYTPCEFQSGNNLFFVTDQSNKSFIFSLTNNDKFKLSNKHKAIKNNTDWGPSFGQGPDLFICDQASKNQNSMANINVSYKNSKYKAHDSESWQRFHGNRQQANFGIQQWQVFALQLS